MQLFTVLVAVVATVGTLHAAIKLNQAKFDRFVMGIVRDVGRYKARKRRFSNNHNSKGLVMTLFHQDDPMEDLLLTTAEDEDESNLATYTKAELFEFGDGVDARPILISLFGRIYDVSAGAKFYGPGKPYADFAGRDVTYSLCTACRTPDCMDMTAEGLDDKLLSEGKRWLSFFHLHDKYPLVGKLESDHLADLMKKMVEETLEKAATAARSIVGGKPLQPPIFRE